LTNGSSLSATPERPYWRDHGPAAVNEVSSSTIATLEDLSANIVDHTIALLKPVFSMFDFAEISREVYQQLIERFQRGQI
jgi:hypothetical protein